MKLLLVCAVLTRLGLALANPPLVRLDSYKVYNVMVNTPEQLKDFHKLGEDLEVHYLKEENILGRSYDVAVAPLHQDKFEERLKQYDFSYKVGVQDMQEVIEKVWNKVDGIIHPGLEWTSYHSLKDIYDWLGHQVLRHPLSVRPYVIGYSYEGRPIKAIKISRRPGNKAIFIDSNIHGVEWISSAAGTCFFDKLLNTKDPEMRKLTLNYDWIFVPMVNPDGFEYTKNVSPLWRKNRRPNGAFNASGLCYGIDLNRNFNFHWKEGGWNVDVPCDHWYAGISPESEPEVVALEGFLKKFGSKYIRMYLALHAFGNYVLLPYAHTTTESPPNYPQMLNISKAFAEAAKVKYGTNFLYGSSASVIYIASGATKDWVYGVLGVPFAATIELRDRGKYGFFLPANQIIQVCEELTDGLVAMVKAAAAEGLFK